jgi:hypothetical protein
MAHERAGTRTLVVADQPGAFTGVSAPLLVVTATYRPQSASGAAFDLVTRG